MLPRFASLLCLLTCLALPLSAAANGMHFFYPDEDADENDPNALIYAGNIKDTNGRYVDDVQVFILITDQVMTIPANNDRPGHYRTPDINAVIRDNNGKPVNPEMIQIDIIRNGYKLARPAAIPRRDKGVYSIDLLLAPTTPPAAQGK
jgi:hypothetical protein